MNIINMRHIIYSIVILIITSSCKKDNYSEVELANREIMMYMNDIYLWYEHIPQVDPASYSSPSALLEDIIYKPLDRWSNLISTQVINDYIQNAEWVGHGFSTINDEEDSVRIAFVYTTTQAYSSGVRRGWIIKKINGIDVTSENFSNLIGERSVSVTNNFEFTDLSGQSQTITLTKEVVNINTVLHSSVIDAGGTKVGYIVYQDFLVKSIDQLNTAFNAFKADNITELIIDLRYNGGGQDTSARHIAGWILGPENEGDVFMKTLHNDKNTRYNQNRTIPLTSNSFDLNRVFFITTSETASASEVLINGLTPYINVYLVGSTTHGKPVGMYVIPLNYLDLSILPVSIRNANANDYSDFYSGFSPNIPANDDTTRDFGDVNEESLKAALDYIQGIVVVKKTTDKIPKKLIKDPNNPLKDFCPAH